VNCPFYFKIGACRHADRCSRLHHRPAFSTTILIKHIYRHPVREAEMRAAAAGQPTPRDEKEATALVDPAKATEDFLQFFENMYDELGKFGRIEALHVCDNLGDHMIGHVYCKFSDEEEAGDALNVMNGRYYDGRKLEVEFSPVSDFREARCRDFDEGTCARGGFCNFMHITPVPMCLIRCLECDCEAERIREADRTSRRHHESSSRRSSSHRERKRSRRDRDRDDRDSKRSRKRRSSKRDSDDDHGDNGSSDGSDRGGRSSRRKGGRDRSYSPSPSSDRSSNRETIQ
jgi:splicing factor U2AF subunit